VTAQEAAGALVAAKAEARRVAQVLAKACSAKDATALGVAAWADTARRACGNLYEAAHTVAFLTGGTP
jgi:hypothetical protein